MDPPVRSTPAITTGPWTPLPNAAESELEPLLELRLITARVSKVSKLYALSRRAKVAAD